VSNDRAGPHGTGRVRIPLEASTHRVRLEGVAKEQTLTVPTLADRPGAPIKVRLVVK
jgi:hypothetical protein